MGLKSKTRLPKIERVSKKLNYRQMAKAFKVKFTRGISNVVPSGLEVQVVSNSWQKEFVSCCVPPRIQSWVYTF